MGPSDYLISARSTKPNAYDIGNSWDIHDYAHILNPNQGINPHRLKENEQFKAAALVHEQLFAT